MLSSRSISLYAYGTYHMCIRSIKFRMVQNIHICLWVYFQYMEIDSEPLYEIYPVVLTVRFTETVYNVSEGEGVMTIGVVLNRPSPQRITIRVVITENTAEGKIIIFYNT